MQTVVMQTGDLPPADRFPLWLSVINQTVMAYDVRTEHADNFNATVVSVDLGGVVVSQFGCPSLEARRTPKLIRASDPESYYLVYHLSGDAEISQERDTVVLGSGDYTLYTSWRPQRSVTRAGDGQELARGMTVQLPRALLPLPDRQVQRLVIKSWPGCSGLAALTSRYLQEMITHGDQYDPADSARLAAVTVDLITAMLAHQIHADDASASDSGGRVLLAQAQSFIQQRLADSALSPGMIAAAHNVSVGHLHRVFRDHGLTVAGLIREQRLQRCLRDLADPMLRDRPIQAIAQRWGLSYPTFNRLFPAVYGMSPGAHRELERSRGSSTAE
jgi:AraC-like DNA-binding protein